MNDLSAAAGGTNPHTVVLLVLVGSVAAVIVVLALMSLVKNASRNVPQLLGDPKWLLLLPCAFGVVWVVAFALGANGHLSAILGAVAAGIVLLLLLFAS